MPFVGPVQVEQLGSQAVKKERGVTKEGKKKRKKEKGGNTLAHVLGGKIGIGGGAIGLTMSVFKH